MRPQVTVGDLTVTALDDGDVLLPPTYYPGLSAETQASMAGTDGTYHIPIGCFLVRGTQSTVLVDAGLGPYTYPFPPQVAREHGITSPPEHIARGGRLLNELAALGVAPTDIDVLVVTHLHADHIGGATDDSGPLFPRAVIYCNESDWQAPLHNPAPGEAEGRERLERAFEQGSVRLLADNIVEVAPEVTARRVGGHTPGHTIVSVGADGRRVYLLGDAVHHPAQLWDPSVSFILEHDPASAGRVREDLFSELADTGVVIGVTHFPGLLFHTIETDTVGRRHWVPWHESP